MAVLLTADTLPDIFKTMLANPSARTHMLFLGPPGSGKTTTAQSFSVALHGKNVNRFASLLFLNSSDERSLETMRQKIYPFVESRMQTLFFQNSEPPPKVIIFDEAETLTDQAQCALRPLLQRDTKEVIIIFICNSLSHIHPQILNKFLVIPFVPTSSTRLQTILHTDVSRLDSLYRRGDIRFFKQCPTQNHHITEYMCKLLHASSPDDVYSLVTRPGTPIRERITWFLLFQQSLVPLDTREISLWSALTASETQPYLDENVLKNMLFNLWKRRMSAFFNKLSGLHKVE
jgi:hypothetical protein